ncbi:MAG: rod shape-determining protein MreC [Patescibacteria group bacterium]
MAWLVVLVMVFIFLQTSSWQSVLTYLQPIVASPISSGYAAGQELKQVNVANIQSKNLKKENQELREKLAQEVTDQAQLQSLIKENDILRQQLDLLPSYEFVSIGVEIIGRRQDEVATSYLINKGSRNGIKIGMPVITKGVLVGNVIQAQPSMAQIALVNSPLHLVTAEVINEKSSRGVVEGEFNLAVRLKLVSSVEELLPGQLVITSGLDELVPRGLVIGSIASVERQEGDFFQSAILTPPLEIDKVRFLRVIIM